MKNLFVAAMLLCVCPGLVSGQTGVSSGTSAVASADDFATRAFQDPWDMNERTDLGWFLNSVDQPASGFSSVNFANGVFTGVFPGGSQGWPSSGSFFLLETGNPFAARVGKVGTNFPIDANTYKLLAFRMKVNQASAVQLFWNRETIYDNTTTRSNNIFTTTGYRVYLVDLTSLGANAIGAAPFAWGGIVKSLRFDATFSADTVELDWARLVNVSAALCRTIAWSGPANVDIYIDNDTNAANGNLGAIALNAAASGASSASAGCSTAGSGYKYYAGALAPGTYHPFVVGTGANPLAASGSNYSSGTWVVNDTPRLTFVTPTEEGSSDDFATSVLGNAWNMNAVSDFDHLQHVTSPRIEAMNLETPTGTVAANVFRATSVHKSVSGTDVGDPYVDPLFITGRGLGNRIDTSKYRILTLEFGIPDKPRDINNGSIARIVWHVAGVMNGPAPVETVSDDIIFNHRAGANVLNKVVLDMADRDVLPIEEGAFAGQQGWINGSSASPGLDIFRIDPHEFDDPTDFFIKRIKLAALEKANTSYNISWTVADANGGNGTVALFYDDDRVVGNGMTQIAAGITGTSHAWNTIGMADGTYDIYASVSDGSNENGTYARWPVVIDLGAVTRPQLAVNRPILNFGVTGLTQKTGTQTVRVTMTGTGSPCWQVDNPLPSIFQVQVIGSNCGSGAFTVSLVDQNYNAGNGEAALVVRGISANSIGNTQTVRARYNIIAASSAPFGTIDTPAENTAVSGSIAVTGWAADDIDITSVQVYRAGIGLEGSADVLIGTAVRVDDARPDIEGMFADTPFNYRAGWGYLLLTNFLPGGGDGAYVIKVYATDREGRRSLLGTRSIVGRNSSSTRPFGAIDTPTQGQTISGMHNNFGWVLARGPHVASPALSPAAHVAVVIDGVPVGSPSGWTSRSDLAGLFPAGTYPGITHALGVFTFDTTTMTNGVHTIAWGVVASNGESDGIGSRYFNVFNSGSSMTEGADASAFVVAASSPSFVGPSLGNRADARRLDDVSPVSVVRGLDRSRTRAVHPAPDGVRLVMANSANRLELRLPYSNGPVPEGYLVVDGTLKALPIGSSFDAAIGAFHWQPGLGFSGAYDFVFVQNGRRIPVRVLMDPRTPDRRAAPAGPYGNLFASTL